MACGGPTNPAKIGTVKCGQGCRRTLAHLPPGETEPAYSRLRMTTRSRSRSRKTGEETVSTWMRPWGPEAGRRGQHAGATRMQRS
jgi:hypothetical protein